MNFVTALMKIAVENGVKTPKAQVERYLSPILEIYLEEILLHTLGNEYKLISSEFPIKKDETNQSTNIDYLLVNMKTSALVFLELKTDSRSFRAAQNDIYKTLLNVKDIGCKLHKDLQEIRENTVQKEKYDFIIKKWGLIPDLDSITKSELIYLVPKKSKDKILSSNNTNVLSFGDLPEEVSIHNEEWLIIRQYLIAYVETN